MIIFIKTEVVMAKAADEKSIFREKSMEKVTSPESLNDYIRVTTPSVWIVLAALVTLLAGMVIWSCFGTVKVPQNDGTVKEVHPITYIIN